MGSDPDIPNRPILYQNPSIMGLSRIPFFYEKFQKGEIMGSDPDFPNRPER